MNLKQAKAKIVKHDHATEIAVAQDMAFQVGCAIEQARLRAGMTQATLARKLHTHQSSIARAESGAHLPSLSFLQKIATAVGAQLNIPTFIFTHSPQSRVRTVTSAS